MCYVLHCLSSHCIILDIMWSLLHSPPPAPLVSQESTQTESVTQFGFQFAVPPPILQNIAIRGTPGQWHTSGALCTCNAALQHVHHSGPCLQTVSSLAWMDALFS